MLLNLFQLHTPKTLSEAAKLYAQLENAKLKAGGTFLLNSLKLLKKRGVKTPDNIISLSKIDILKGITQKKDVISIKSMTTLSEIMESPDLDKELTVLKHVSLGVGTTPIRNMATIGGNMTCRYVWTEMPSLCIALDAKMHFLGADNKEYILSAEDFFKNKAKTDKILTQITFLHDKKNAIAYHRVKKTVSVDIPFLTVCIKTSFTKKKFSQTKVVINDCQNFPKRDHVLEEFLNQNSSKHLAQEAIHHLDDKISDIKDNDYKKHMLKFSIKKCIQDLTEKK